MNWHQLSSTDVLKKLESDSENGLSPDQVEARQGEYGPNSLHQARQTSALMLFLSQLKNPLLVILAVGAVLSFMTGHHIDAIAISVIIVINAMISFVQEYKAQKSIDALKNMAAPKCLAMRDGEWQKIPASELVPGDLIKLANGDIIPADARLLKADSLQIDEAALTGESELAQKQAKALPEADLALGDQSNRVFMSTPINRGQGIAVVTETGMQTEVGKIADLMQTTESRLSPLQRRIQELSHALIWAAFVVVALIVALGIYQGLTAMELVTTTISLVVAAIPEGMPTVVTIVLTLGAKQMMHRHALAKQLASVETLGATSVICSDKTGTLTQNKMQTLKLWASGEIYDISGQGYEPKGDFTDPNGHVVTPEHHFHLTRMLGFSVLCSDTELMEENGQYRIQGLPTEGAVVVAAAKAGITAETLQKDFSVVRTHPFDSGRKMMSVVVQDDHGQHHLIVKGAPDVVARHSDAIDCGDKRLDIVSNESIITEVVEAFGREALRTLAVAHRPLQDNEIDLPAEKLEHSLIINGIHGIIDPPRPEATKAVHSAHKAGVRVVMITGDHAVTAKAIAAQMGIVKDESADVITGPELNQISDEELITRAANVSVYARVTPEHKLRIVQALQSNGDVIAMTGDGVNDAPALRKADIGIAMGQGGTDVAKDSSDLILLDDNFATIVNAVSEGRRIYDNIRKFIRQALTANVSEVSAILFAFLVIIDEPMLSLAPLMILWINLVSDGIPALALGFDAAEDDVMKRQPRASGESFFADHLGTRIVARGLVMGGMTFFMFFHALSLGESVAYAQTLAFMTLIFGQLVHVFDARTFTTLFQRNPFSNRMLLGAVALSAALSLLMVYTPFGQLAIGTEALSSPHLLMALFMGALPTLALSSLKQVFGLRWL
ncbi:MAG: cation-transporting P-type ATPase [Hydrogenovibrio sp.]|uniref:cation-translocating P-type ATPase n=1 Tax=Hydrogenovibrio sp. TaxID=2065821 RepID=UPI002870AE90|nr:cation-transporting P-type ATPase [Hydrogenovibrio sp.]MDR9499394.1 cation-transporting P-type ATPase [Hydrogenovibrio sp.]